MSNRIEVGDTVSIVLHKLTPLRRRCLSLLRPPLVVVGEVGRRPGDFVSMFCIRDKDGMEATVCKRWLKKQAVAGRKMEIRWIGVVRRKDGVNVDLVGTSRHDLRQRLWCYKKTNGGRCVKILRMIEQRPRRKEI